MPTVKAKIKAELLVWAREESGLGTDEAAQKIGISPERLAEWEAGEDGPSIAQLRKVAEVYKRPLAVFYLPEVPRRFRVMQDFRRLPGEVAGHYSPKFRLEMRNAELRRDLAVELYQEIGEEPPRFVLQAALDDNAEQVGLAIRDALQIAAAEQARWREPRVAFNAWRAAIEAAGVLVFQAIDIPLAEMRGFSIASDVMPVVAANRKDSYAGRAFSLLHELTHLMLRRSGICDLEEEAHRPPEEQRIEIFCNMVAGAALLPRNLLLHDPIVAAAAAGRVDWSDEILVALARRFAVSREVVLRRLLISGRTSEAFYVAARQRFLAEYQEREERERKDEGEYRRNIPVETVGHFGPTFVRLVLNTYYQRRITLNDVSAYLGVRLKHIPRVEKVVEARVGHASAL
jgi:Zn-dependent peptidase ImmA (M78 family)/DNA-binding XRE family transcriptional regulator